MRYLKIGEVLSLYQQVMKRSGGKPGLMNVGALESSLAQPKQAFEGKDLYPGIVEKAAVLGFSMISNHPFTDGNKRIGHACIELFLMLNGHEIDAPVSEQEDVILRVADGSLQLPDFTSWLRNNIRTL